MPLFSIVVPVYNVAQYLPACLDSILAQDTEAAYEVILVDDGSTDGSGGVCDAYAARRGNFRVIHQENAWLSAARNTGLRAAAGEYVIFLDADDYWEPTLLTEVSRSLEERPDMAAFGFVRLLEDGAFHRELSPDVLPRGETGREWLERLFTAGMLPPFYAWCYAYRRDFLLENRLYFREDLRSSEDFVFNMEAFPLAERIVGVPPSLYVYRQRSGSLTAAPSFRKLMDDLTTKAAAFRRFPTEALAICYAGYVAQVGALPKEEAKGAMGVLRENRDILEGISSTGLRLLSPLVRLLGFYRGARVFLCLRRVKHRFF